MHIQSRADGRTAKLTMTELRQLAVAQRICTQLAECAGDAVAKSAAPLLQTLVNGYSREEKATAEA